MKFNSKELNLPRHIAIIMDGNGRWAKKRLLPRKMGHREGVKAIHRIVNDIFTLDIPYITLYAFSTENKLRPKDEVDSLFQLMEEYFSTFTEELISKDIRMTFMGDLTYFPQSLQTVLKDASSKSVNNKRGTLNIALNYGARDEIMRAVNIAVSGGKELTADDFGKLLYTSEIPDPDIILRTGGEFRLSNFMLFQAAYAELFFTKTLWPAVKKEELYSILVEYSKRNRRFGKV